MRDLTPIAEFKSVGYDIDFILTKEKSENDEGFTIMGAKNVNGSGLVWNNNTPIKDEETKK